MDRFNTGNALNSADERDLFDNSMNFDVAMNSTAKTFTDRFGVEKPTIDYALKSTGFMPAGFDFVSGGVLNPGDRNKCVYNPAPNGDNNWYRWNGAFPKEIAPNSQPNPKDENNWVLAHFRIGIAEKEALRRTYLEVGLNLVEGSFEEGGTLQSVTDVLLEEKTGKVYSWTGSFPKEISPNTLPGFDVLFLDKTQSSLLSILKGPDGKGQTDVYYGGGWTGAEAGSSNLYDNPNHTSLNALRIRWKIPKGENTDPTFWWEKHTRANKTDGWEQGNQYNSLIKEEGTAFGCAGTDYAQYDGGSGDLIARHCRTHLNSSGSAGFALWAYTKVTSPTIARAVGAEITINNGAIAPSWISEASGDPVGIGALTALNLGVADGLYGIHHAMRIPNKNADDFKRPWTGILMGQNSIMPADANGNGEAIRIRGASFTSGRYGAIAFGDDTGAQMFSYGIRSIHADFSNNALIWAKIGQKIVWGNEKNGASYISWDSVSDTFKIGKNGLSIGSQKVLGSRITGIYSLTGTGDGTTKNIETITTVELGRYVKKIADALIEHGLIGN